MIRILLVEDEHDHAAAQARFLKKAADAERLAVYIQVVDDGGEGLLQIASAEWNLVITDVRLGPGPDGFAVYLAARKRGFPARITSSAPEAAREQLERGVSTYVLPGEQAPIVVGKTDFKRWARELIGEWAEGRPPE